MMIRRALLNFVALGATAFTTLHCGGEGTSGTGGGGASSTATATATGSGGQGGAPTSTTGASTGATSASTTSASTSSSSGSASSSSSTGGGPPPVLRIMPLGDSTTGSVCWRADLWQMLNQAGHVGKFDFVGSEKNDPGCGVAGYDQDNEGHPTCLITEVVNNVPRAGCDTTLNALAPALLAHPADVVLFHFATNDVWNGKEISAIQSAYTTILGTLRQANPKVIVLVAKLIPMNVTAATCAGCTCSGCPAEIDAFNNTGVPAQGVTAIQGWATAHSTAASPILVVDQNTGFSATTDTKDGVHPNASGSTKIATKWAAALETYF